MKFHSNLKTVLIALGVLLMFVFSSVFIITELDLTSPTLLVTNTLFQSLTEKDTDISFSFESMERNFRDRVKVNGITVKVKDIEVAEINSIEIKMGIFDLLSYLMRGKTSAEIVAENGDVKLTQALFDSFKSGSNSTNKDKVNVEKEAKYNFTLNLENFSISILDEWIIDGVTASVSMDERMTKLDASIGIPEVKFTYNDYVVGLNDVSFNINKKEEINAKFSVESLFLLSSSFSLNTGILKGNASFASLDTLDNIKGKVDIEITARDKADMQFHPLMKMEVDPTSIFIDRSPLKANPVVEIQHKGDKKEKVDLVFVAEGYTAAEQDKFVADAKRFMEALFQTKPYDTRRDDFNVWAVGTISEESGTSVSGKGVYKNTALKTGYYTFGVDRYLTTQDIKPIRDAVWNVPCDAIFLLINTDTYGGGGMYNFYACGTADNDRTPTVFTHEFGHSFAGLADEYAYEEEAIPMYPHDVEPWEPNITTLVNFSSKWEDMVKKGTKIPTPLSKKPEVAKTKVGVFEGAGYSTKGVYRGVQDCRMRINDTPEFCPVCKRAITHLIDFYTK